MNLEEAITKTEESLLKVQAEIGQLQELLEQARKRRDNEAAVLQALQFAKQAVAKAEEQDGDGSD
jgi:cation transport regulator ChaB